MYAVVNPENKKRASEKKHSNLDSALEELETMEYFFVKRVDNPVAYCVYEFDKQGNFIQEHEAF